MSKDREKLIEYLKTESYTDAEIAQTLRPTREEVIAETIEDLKLLNFTDAQIAEVIGTTKQAGNSAPVETATPDEPEAEIPPHQPEDGTLKEMMTIAEAAAYLGISINALYNRIEKFKIPVFWLAGHWRLDKSKVKELNSSYRYLWRFGLERRKSSGNVSLTLNLTGLQPTDRLKAAFNYRITDSTRAVRPACPNYSTTS